MNVRMKKLAALLAFVMCCTVAFAQNTVSGKVKDNTGETVIGATVQIKGGTTGVITDIDGNYTISGVLPSDVLVFSFLGYTTQEVKVGNQKVINVTLMEDAQDLDEVVLVGYGVQKKSDLTGSVGVVDMEVMLQKGSPNLLETMQGAVPGVSITQSGGRDQAGFDIQIRGKSSINGNVTPLYVVDGVIVSDIDFLNPQDIDRIDILKDASSTAIYGSRATAGVVMITTKSGANTGKKNIKNHNVSYDGYYGINQLSRMPDFMDGEEFYDFRFAQFVSLVASGEAQPYTYMTLADFQQGLLWDGTSKVVLKESLKNGQIYDWPLLVTRDGMEHNHYLSVSGGAESVNYHMGVGFNQKDGNYVGDSKTRINAKGSVDARINKVFSAGASFNLAMIQSTYGSDSGIGVAYRMNPFNRPYDKDGNPNLKPGNYESMGTAQNQFTDAMNPLVYLDNETKERDTYRFLGNAYLEAKPFKGLSIKTSFMPSYVASKVGYYAGDATGGTPTASIDNSTSFDWTWDNIINYNLEKNNHSLGVMGLFSMNAYNRNKSYVEVTEPMEGTQWYNIATGTAQKYTSGYDENSMISYAMRLNYSYKGRYLFTGTVRSDGSSKFAQGYRWGTFPSAAFAWRASEEDFLKSVEWLSNLKLRLSYGVTGNNAGIGNYATHTTGAGPHYYAYGNNLAYGYYPSGVVNSALSWETTKEKDLGVDFGFLKNRITGSIDLYDKLSEGLLYDRQLPLVSGGGSLTDNIGKVRNRGIEVALSTVNVKTKNWYWETSFSFSSNKNSVEEINGSSDFILGDNPITQSLFVGQPVNNIYSYQWDGIVSDKPYIVPDNEASVKNGFNPGETVVAADYYYKVYGWTEGRPIIKDQNGDGAIDADNDKIILGSQDPAWIGSFNTSVAYKNWDLTMSVYTKQNYLIYSNFLYEYYNYAYRGYQHLSMDYYIPAGTLIDCDGINADGSYINPVYQEVTHYGSFPAPNSNSAENYGAGTYWLDKGNSNLAAIVDASYWKVKNIVLGYTLPKTVLNKVGIEKLRLYLNVTNPFVWTQYRGFDPEWAGSSSKNDGPSTITYQLGVNLKF